MNLAVLPTAKQQAHQETVEILEEWLQRAKRGEIIQVALAGLNVVGDVSTEYSSSVHFFPLLGGVELLKFRLLKETQG